MKILLVGSGGREHALALGLRADTACTELHVAPGNPGIADIATLHPLVITDNAAIADLAQSLAVDLVVIGPEVPLVNGAADAIRAIGIPVFGPSKAAAQLEGSKASCEMPEFLLRLATHAQLKKKSIKRSIPLERRTL
jgi:phosphoribosylamine--glycine ligase